MNKTQGVHENFLKVKFNGRHSNYSFNTDISLRKTSELSTVTEEKLLLQVSTDAQTDYALKLFSINSRHYYRQQTHRHQLSSNNTQPASLIYLVRH